jgi:hypothetical protein
MEHFTQLYKSSHSFTYLQHVYTTYQFYKDLKKLYKYLITCTDLHKTLYNSTQLYNTVKTIQAISFAGNFYGLVCNRSFLKRRTAEECRVLVRDGDQIIARLERPRVIVIVHEWPHHDSLEIGG